MSEVWTVIDQLGGRKAFALLIMSLLGVGAVVWKGDVPSNFMSLMEFIFGAFIAGNAVEHAAGAYSDTKGNQDTPTSTIDLAPLEAHLATTQEGVATVQKTLGFIMQKAGMVPSNQ